MEQKSLFNGSINDNRPKSKGPANRMNDLIYKDWMKFQKSFFDYSTPQKLTEEFVNFFTKATWPDGQSSISLIVGIDNIEIDKPRVVDVFSSIKTIYNVIEILQQCDLNESVYDFILIDLRKVLTDEASIMEFLNLHSDILFSLFKKILQKDRYGCILIGQDSFKFNKGFPIAWSLALSSRKYLRLRDEKIGLIKDNGDLVYCIFMQSADEQRGPLVLNPDMIDTEYLNIDIPSWVIPKPPARKPNEILHPAKFPETLIEVFIKLFTKTGDTIFDPMVGTGSAVLSAVQNGRNGVGIDLNADFVEIAKDRLTATGQLSILDSHSKAEFKILQGDSTKLYNIKELIGFKCKYAITSPPYWSMLANPGSENQKARRDKNLQLTYSEEEHDLGNINDYDHFMKVLVKMYEVLADYITDNGYLTVIVKNVKRNHVVYPIAWDLVSSLCRSNGKYSYIGNTFWLQDNVGLKPFAIGTHWVSNTLHQYCLHMRKKP